MNDEAWRKCMICGRDSVVEDEVKRIAFCFTHATYATIKKETEMPKTEKPSAVLALVKNKANTNIESIIFAHKVNVQKFLDLFPLKAVSSLIEDFSIERVMENMNYALSTDLLIEEVKKLDAVMDIKDRIGYAGAKVYMQKGIQIKNIYSSEFKGLTDEGFLPTAISPESLSRLEELITQCSRVIIKSEDGSDISKALPVETPPRASELVVAPYNAHAAQNWKPAAPYQTPVRVQQVTAATPLVVSYPWEYVKAPADGYSLVY